MNKDKKGNYPFLPITNDVLRLGLALSVLFGNIFLILVSIFLLQIDHQDLFFLTKMRLPQAKIPQIALFQICISLHHKIVYNNVNQFENQNYFMYEKIYLTSLL